MNPIIGTHADGPPPSIYLVWEDGYEMELPGYLLMNVLRHAWHVQSVRAFKFSRDLSGWLDRVIRDSPGYTRGPGPLEGEHSYPYQAAMFIGDRLLREEYVKWDQTKYPGTYHAKCIIKQDGYDDIVIPIGTYEYDQARYIYPIIPRMGAGWPQGWD